jgi:hypothetical protein
MVKTFDELKEKFSEIYNDEKSHVNFDYVTFNKQDNPYATYSLEIEQEIQKKLLKLIHDKIKLDNLEIVNFELTDELAKGQVGCIETKKCTKQLSNFLKSVNQPNRESSASLSKDMKSIVAYTLSFSENSIDAEIKVIVKLNLKNYLSKKKNKARFGIVYPKVTEISNELVIISPENFDIITFQDTAFIFDETNFHFLFSDSEYIMKRIENKKYKLENIIQSVDKYLAYAKKYPYVLRGTYHIVENEESFSLNLKEVSYIQKEIEKQTDKTEIFQYDNGKIICTEENAKYIYWLLAKKYDLNLLKDQIEVVASTRKL